MWALALTLVAALPPLTEFARPDGAVKDPLVQVLLTGGKVSITPASGKLFDARNGMKLAASDTITVGPGAWAAIHILRNDHVVRLDDDLSLRVTELALLNAPKHTETLEQQFNRLVTPKEQESAGRLIGWNAGQAGASVPSNFSDTGGSGKATTNPTPPVKTKEAYKQPPPPPKPPGGSRNVVGGSATDDEERKPDPAPPPPTVPASTAPAPTPMPVAPLVADATLTTCLVETLEPLGPEVKKALGKKVLLRVKVKADGSLVVQLPRGVNAPECARTWFTGKPGLGAQWSDVTVSLP